jgi:5-methylcytosine-specific restriction endonuclease McrA
MDKNEFDRCLDRYTEIFANISSDNVIMRDAQDRINSSLDELDSLYQQLILADVKQSISVSYLGYRNKEIGFFGLVRKMWRAVMGKGYRPATYWVVTTCPTCKAKYVAMFESKPGQKVIRNVTKLCSKCEENAEKLRASDIEKWTEQENKNRVQFQQRLSELKAMPYHEYLQTPEWDRTRKIAYKRAKYACQMCGDGGVVLNVHHNKYDNLGNEHREDLFVLCRSCHSKFHGKSEEGEEEE